MTDLTPNDLSHLSDEEFNALCPQGYHAPGPAEPLSPAAQAVMDAMHRSYDHEPTRRALAAGVLRAAADQVVPKDLPTFVDGGRSSEEQWMAKVESSVRQQLFAIAAELEGPSFNEIMQLAGDFFVFRGNSHGDSFFATEITAKTDPTQALDKFARAVLERWGTPANNTGGTH